MPPCELPPPPPIDWATMPREPEPRVWMVWFWYWVMLTAPPVPPLPPVPPTPTVALTLATPPWE